MKRIEKGPVRGISLKLQEEERERKMDFIPEKSAIQLSNIDFSNPIVNRMIKELDIQSIIKEHRPARK
jgi:small subunit ribosomal protein S17e